MIDGHGDDLHRYGGRISHNFSTNIFTPAPDAHQALMAHLAKASGAISSYPEPDAASLAAHISDHHQLTNTGCAVTVGNGATEIIYLIAHAFAGAHSAILGPTFAEYADACRLHRHRVSHIDSLTALPSDADILWLCNPNNPTGTVIDPDTLSELAEARPNMLVVVDQAYQLYSVDATLADSAVDRHPNIVILKSLTKQYGVPGLRVGYSLSSPEIARRISSARMPWSVNALAIEAAHWLLDHSELYPIDAAGLHAEALRLSREFSAMGIECSPTRCNFILCRLPQGSAADLKQWLAEEHGILIRDASNFHGLSEAHFRVAAQSPNANTLLINALRQWLTE